MTNPLPQPEPGQLCAGWKYRILVPEDADAVFEAFTASDDMARQGDVIDDETARAYVHTHTDRTRGVTLVAVDAKDRV